MSPAAVSSLSRTVCIDSSVAVRWDRSSSSCLRDRRWLLASSRRLLRTKSLILTLRLESQPAPQTGNGLCDLLLQLGDLLLQPRCRDLDAQNAAIGLVDDQRVVREVVAELDRLGACQLETESRRYHGPERTAKSR